MIAAVAAAAMFVVAVAAVLIEATATVSVVAAASVRAVALAGATAILNHPLVEELDLVAVVEHLGKLRVRREKKVGAGGCER